MKDLSTLPSLFRLPLLACAAVISGLLPLMALGNAQPPTAPVAYWSFDQNFNVTIGDAAFDGIPANGAAIDATNSRFGGASARFRRGQGQYVEIPTSPIPTGQSFTYAAWYYLDLEAISGSARYTVLETAPSWSISYAFRQISGEQIAQVYTHDNGVAGSPNDTFLNISAAPHRQWRHIAVTFHHETRMFEAFLDGQSVGTLPLRADATELTPSSRLIIGAHRALARQWEGWIDDVGIWHYALTPEEIAYLQENPIPHGEARPWHAFEPIDAPVTLDFGQGPGKDDGSRLVQNFPGKFSLEPDALRFVSTNHPLGPSVAALAAVSNYQNRQNFSLETNFALNRFTEGGVTTVGFAALVGPHTEETPFDVETRSDFYGLLWAPGQNSSSSALEIREGFSGEILAVAPWEGPAPFAGGEGGSTIFFEDFEDLAGAQAAWTIGGSHNLWQIGAPTGGPGAAYSGQNVAGTGLGENDKYQVNTNAWLRSPVIDLSGFEEAVTLSFREFLDVDDEIDASGFFHYTTVTVLDGETLNPIAELSRDAGHLEDWRIRQFQLPDASLGRQIVVEFRLRSDAFLGNQFDGWFVDDVTISGFQPMEYQMTAEGNFLPSGAVELSVTLTAENGHSQTLSTTVAQPSSGNLFGFGGGLAGTDKSWEIDFKDFSIGLGTFSLPLSMGPASSLFGSADGRGGTGGLYQTAPEDWFLDEESILLAPVEPEPRNSLAALQIGNFIPGRDFFVRQKMTLVSLDRDPSDNRIGLVLFGHEDPTLFDAEADSTFYTFQWIPNSATGSLLLFRQGMDGPIVTQVNLADFSNPPAAPSSTDPQAGIGQTYTF